MATTAEYCVGQEVEVTYRARVAEVDPGIGHPRAGVRLRLEAMAPAVTGWVEPEAFGGFSIKVVGHPLPTEQGMYRVDVGELSQDNMQEYHADGYEFYYLNAQGNWVDVGWGQPRLTDAPLLEGPSEKWTPRASGI